MAKLSSSNLGQSYHPKHYELASLHVADGPFDGAVHAPDAARFQIMILEINMFLLAQRQLGKNQFFR